MSTNRFYVGTNEDLTPQEITVLGKLAIGGECKQIATDMHMTKDNVYRIVKGILRKLGAGNATAAVYVAAKNNMI